MQDGTPEDSEAVIFTGDDHEEQVIEDSEADLTRLARLFETTDAMVWAKEWCIVARKLEYLGKPVIDEGWMVGWFANAIEVGRDAGRRSVDADFARVWVDPDWHIDGRGRE